MIKSLLLKCVFSVWAAVDVADYGDCIGDWTGLAV